MKTFFEKTKAKLAFKRVQPLPMAVGRMAVAGKPGVQMIPDGEFPLHPAGGSAVRSGGLRLPGAVSDRSNALTISAWAESGRMFA